MSDNYSGFPPIQIIAYSDFYTLPDPRVWGDYWLKENLLSGFKRLGYPVAAGEAGIRLHLFGEPLEALSADTYNILWLHSHPDRITPEVLAKYSKIFCISKLFTEKLRMSGVDADFLMMPTNMKPVVREKIYDIVFVGNTRQNKARKIICDLGDSAFDIKIWGWGWKGLIPDRWYAGEYYENSRLNELYASSKIVLNDHHEDMRREGFINPRVLDVLASGGFVVSDSNRGLDELLPGCVATYSAPQELRDTVPRYMNNDDERRRMSEKGTELALRFSFEDACKTIIRHIVSAARSERLL